MPSCSEGNAYPNDLSSIATPDSHVDANKALHFPDPTDTPIGLIIEARIADAQSRNRASGQRGRSWALPGQPPALCWSGRARWLVAVDVALATEEGRSLCRARHLSPITARAIARGCADFADSSTGRHLTASNATIAARAADLAGRPRPWSHDVVANTRFVLEALGLAVEIVRGRYLTATERLAAAVHHDGVQLRAASTWALMLVRRWQVKSYLPRRGSTGSKTPRSRYSPNARKRATAPFGRLAKTPPGPRPLAAQIVTAQLVQRAHGLDNGRHLGALVGVIADLVDCDRWTGRDLAELLDQDARDNPRDWPATIQNPAGFLRHRLSRLSDLLAGPSPSQTAAAHHRAVQQERFEREVQAQQANRNRASSDHVAGVMAQIREQLAHRRSARDASASGHA